MKAVQFLFGLLVSTAYVQATGPDWWSMDSDLNSPQIKSVVYQQMLGTLDIDGIGKLPVWARFESSHRFPESPIFRKNWYIPLLQSHAVLLDESHLMVDFPDGKTLIFSRNVSTGAITPIGEWAPELNGNAVVINSKSGWTMIFQRGRLVTIKKGTVTVTVSDKAITANGKPVLKVEIMDSVSGRGMLSIGNHSVAFELGKTPNIQKIAGNPVISGFDSTLTKLRWDNGCQTIFENQVGPDFINHVTMTESNPATASSKDCQNVRTFAYDAASGINTAQSLSNTDSNENSHSIEISTYYKSGLLAGRLRSIKRGTPNDDLACRLSYDENGAILRGTLGSKEISKKPNLTVSINARPSWFYDTTDGTFRVVALPATP